MLDFVRWLAAIGDSQRCPCRLLQAAYSEALREAQLDSLQENLLASAVLEFAAKHAQPECGETPSKLLSKLIEEPLPDGREILARVAENPMALSKRLNALKASLATQGCASSSAAARTPHCRHDGRLRHQPRRPGTSNRSIRSYSAS